jgi:hypothetical protein
MRRSKVSAVERAAARTPPPRADRIVAWRLGEERSRRPEVVPHADIFFAFTVKVVKQGAIDAEWTTSTLVKGSRVRVRTPAGVFETRWRSLDEAVTRLSTLPMRRTYHGALVNLKRIDVVDFEGKRKRVGFLIGKDSRGYPKTEWVRVSRRAARVILDELG